MVGTSVSQGLAIATYPILSRLYTPAEMGVVAFFLGIWSTLSVVFSGRYELAIILPKTDTEASNIAGLSLFLASFCCIVSFVFIFIFYPYFSSLGKNNMEWLYIVPISAFLLSFIQILEYLATRFKEYQKIAIKSIFLQFVYVSCAIIFGIWDCVNNGLILSRVLAYVGTSLLITWLLFDKIQMLIKNLSVRQMRESAIRYKQFLLCNVPYSFLGSFSRESVIFAFVAFGYSEGAGLYALARYALFLPLNFLSTTLSQAFYKEAVTTIGTPKLEQLVLQLINCIVIFGVPGGIFFSIWSSEIFSFFFGEVWREAGTYATIFMPAAFLSLLTSWPERMYEVTQKQHISLSIQVFFDFFSILTLWTMLTFGANLLNCILIYTIINCVYHMTYLISIFKISNFNLSHLLGSGFKILSLTVLSLLVFYISSMTSNSLIANFISNLFCLLSYYLCVLYLNTTSIENFKLKYLMIH
jgi:O-antigen/teichoic acid export membrane protein